MLRMDEIEDLEIAYVASFAHKIEKPWGLLFWNEDNPGYYDANHAHIRCIPNNPKLVVEEVVMFYREKHITPRFYIYNIENQNELIVELKATGFNFEEFDDSLQLWDNVLGEKDIDNKIIIEQVNKNNFTEALAIECSIKMFGGKEVREQAFREEFNHPSYAHFMLIYNNTPCSIASIFIHGKQARLENVATLNQFRGKGLIGELIYYIQKLITEKEISKLWVFPISEEVEKVYQKYGFETVSRFKTGHAYLDGKGIKEIRER